MEQLFPTTWFFFICFGFFSGQQSLQLTMLVKSAAHWRVEPMDTLKSTPANSDCSSNPSLLFTSNSCLHYYRMFQVRLLHQEDFHLLTINKCLINEPVVCQQELSSVKEKKEEEPSLWPSNSLECFRPE